MAFRQGMLVPIACLYQFYEERGTSFDIDGSTSIEYENYFKRNIYYKSREVLLKDAIITSQLYEATFIA